MEDMKYQAKYSGPNRTGICVCGHYWEDHHLGMVMRQKYIDDTHEGYIPQECEAFGFNETGGLMYDEEKEEWVNHCQHYTDKGEL